MKKGLVRTLVCLAATGALSACGVKADPQPPMTPAEIGHGKPLYKNEEDSVSPLQRKNFPDEEKNDEDTDENK